MAVSRVATLACFLLLSSPFAAYGVEAMTCSDAMKAIIPCLGYLTGKAAAPPPLCCTSVQNLNNTANTPEKRKSICNCLKDEAKTIPDLKPEPVSHLPHLCKIEVAFKISLDMTCSDVH